MLKDFTDNRPISLHRPSRKELSYRQKLLADSLTMAYNAAYDKKGIGMIDFPPETWQRFMDRWQKRSHFYAYIMMKDQPIGEIYYYPVGDLHHMGVLIEASHRGKGFAKQAMELLLEKAFVQDDVLELQNYFEDSRKAAKHLHVQLGFSVVEEKEGMITLSLTAREYWKNKRQIRGEAAYVTLVEALRKRQHILITGSLGSGKTWLVERLEEEKGPFHGLRSYKEGDNIWMEERQEKRPWRIGKRQASNMVVLPEGFQKATHYLSRFLKEDHHRIIIDEVGFLEITMTAYLETLIQLANIHPLLLVLRKDRHALLNHLQLLEPFQFLDLDNF